MIYTLYGHTYRHAVEEMLLHLLPVQTVAEGEKTPDDGFCSSRLQYEGQTLTVTAQVTIAGQTRESTRTGDAGGCDALSQRRLETELIQLTIYDAVVPFLEAPPVWGSLTGVRPAKLARGMMERGMSNAQTAKRLREHFMVSPERTALTIRAAAVARHCLEQLQPQDISIYIGIPFCPSRCRYCSFISADVSRNAALIPQYVDALCQEIEMTGDLLQAGQYRVSSIYIGGGTPTTLEPEQLEKLMVAVQKSINLDGLREYTVEAGRPDTITREKLLAVKHGGATRISINPQTMNPAVLERIGRRHTVQQVFDAFALAREIGFSSINMDTIAGLEGDTPESFAQTIAVLTDLHPENITVHTLAIKRGADLTDKRENQMQREAVGEMLRRASDRLTQTGYAPYYLYRQKFSAGGFENVGWCLPETESLYNVLMMEELQTIVSLGAGAVSKRVERDTGKITRFTNPKYPLEYLQAGARMREARRKLLER